MLYLPKIFCFDVNFFSELLPVVITKVSQIIEGYNPNSSLDPNLNSEPYQCRMKIQAFLLRHLWMSSWCDLPGSFLLRRCLLRFVVGLQVKAPSIGCYLSYARCLVRLHRYSEAEGITEKGFLLVPQVFFSQFRCNI